MNVSNENLKKKISLHIVQVIGAMFEGVEQFGTVKQVHRISSK